MSSASRSTVVTIAKHMADAMLALGAVSPQQRTHEEM
jgi:hypothetical protein